MKACELNMRLTSDGEKTYNPIVECDGEVIILVGGLDPKDTCYFGVRLISLRKGE